VIDAWVPLFLFSVLFALSMDYQVFLMSRIRERYDQTGSTRDAVVWGVSSTARIITGAALIIVVVFAGFARGQLVMFQQMGFGVAVALLLDATIIRSVVLPSMLTLLDRWSWYLPRWLEGLPRVEVERPASPEGGAATVWTGRARALTPGGARAKRRSAWWACACARPGVPRARPRRVARARARDCGCGFARPEPPPAEPVRPSPRRAASGPASEHSTPRRRKR